MKGTTKIILAFGIAIVLVAVVIVVTILSDGDNGKDGTTAYQTQPTTTPTYDNTENWINVSELAGDLVTASDTTEPPATTILSDGTVIVLTTTEPGVSYIFVDGNGNIVNPSDVNIPSTQANTRPPSTTHIETDVVEDNDPGESEVQLSEYEVDSRTGYITKYNGSGGYVGLSNLKSINGVEIKGIGPGAFAGSAVTYIDIGPHITYIGDRAFENCVGLTSVAFGNGSEPLEIGFRAFSGCLNLKEVTLPVCKVIGQSAFENCTSLRTVKVPIGSKEIGTACFYNCVALESLHIPDTVETIGKNVLGNCSKDKLTVYVHVGSKAEEYADNAGYKTGEYKF